MKQFDEKDYNAVKVYEKDFTNAVNSRFCTGLTMDELNIIHDIYRSCLNRQANLSCGGCVLQMMISVGRLYFAYKDEKEKQKAKKDEEGKNKRKKGKRNTSDESDNQLS